MDMTFEEFKYLTSACWIERYQPLTIDMTKDNNQGRYRLGLNSIILPNTTPFPDMDTHKYKNILDSNTCYYNSSYMCNNTKCKVYLSLINEFLF